MNTNINIDLNDITMLRTYMIHSINFRNKKMGGLNMK